MAKFWAKVVKMSMVFAFNHLRQTDKYPVPITRKTGRIILRKTSILHSENPKSKTMPSKAGSTFFGVSVITVS